MKDPKSTSRREALGLFGALPAAAALVTAGAARAQARGERSAGSRQPSAPQAAPGSASPASAPPLAIVSRHLQWTSIEDGIQVAKAAGFPGIAWTVRPGAHIGAAEVETALPRTVKLTADAGLATPMIITNIGDVTAPRIEAVLGTMQKLGIRRYRAAAPRYNYTSDFAPQYDDFRRKLEALAKLNERFDTVAMFHTHSYANTIGGSGWDLWMLMKDLDPRYVGINYDIGHTTAKGGAGWRESLRAAHRHVRAVSVKDFLWRRRSDVQGDAWPWQTEFVPPGQGMVNFPEFFRTIKELGFDGPVETYFEYKVEMPGQAKPMDMLGTNFGQWKLEIPREQFIGYLKRDVDFYKGHMQRAGYTL